MATEKVFMIRKIHVNNRCQKADTYYTNKDLQSVLHEGWAEALAP